MNFYAFSGLVYKCKIDTRLHVQLGQLAAQWSVQDLIDRMAK